MLPVRVFFEKTGCARFISHLDLMRCFERAMRRSGIPFWYTEGFNPRPYLTFALPLSLGTAGLRESVDLRLNEEMSFDEVRDRFNACLPDGLRVLEAAEPVMKPKEITASRYVISLSSDSPAELSERLNAFLAQDEITVTKLNKKKQRVETDIRPLIFSASAQPKDDHAELTAVLASGTEKTLNPTLLLDAFFGDDQRPAVSVVRCAVLAGEKEFA